MWNCRYYVIQSIFSSHPDHEKNFELFNLTSTYISVFSFYSCLSHHLSFKLEKLGKGETKGKEWETKQKITAYSFK